MSRHPIQTVADAMRKRWRGAPPIHVVSTAAALPFKAPDDTEGAYHRGEVLLVADALHPARAVTVLAHETVAHHGLRQLLGRAWPSFMGGVIDGSRRDGFLRGARGHVERVYTDDAGACNLTQRQLADEMAAAVVERRMDLVTMGLSVEEPLRKQALAVRGHLAREVLLVDHPVCADQLDGALLLAERRVRHGRKFFGWAVRVADWYAARMSKPYDFSKRPMTHEESKALLRGEEQRRQRKDERFVFWHIAALALLLGVVLVGFGSVGLDLLRWLFR